MNWLLAGIFGYLAIQLAIGIVVSRRIHNETDYILAGRSLGIGLASFSIFATWFGAESIQGAAGTIYAEGLSGGSADPFGYVACILLVGLVFARPLWNRGFTTFGDLFRLRYSVLVERVAILLMVPTSVLWGAAQVRAFGNVVSHASALPIEWAITGAALFVVGYSAVGGLLADAWTDVVQGLAVIVGLVVIAGLLLANGTLQQAWTQVPAARLSLVSAGTPWYVTLEAWAVPVVGSMLAVEIISRILGCRSAETARRACFVGGSLYLAVGLIPAVLGLCGPLLVPDLVEAEQLVPELARLHLGTVPYILFTGALISAILSTVDSILLAGSALITHNVLLQLRPDLSDRAKLRWSRAGVLGLGVLSWALALTSESISSLVEYASAFGSAGIFVVATFGLFTTIGGTASALASLATGMLVWAAGAFLLEWPAPYVSALVAAAIAYLAAAPFGAALAATTDASARRPYQNAASPR